MERSWLDIEVESQAQRVHQFLWGLGNALRGEEYALSHFLAFQAVLCRKFGQDTSGLVEALIPLRFPEAHYDPTDLQAWKDTKALEQLPSELRCLAGRDTEVLLRTMPRHSAFVALNVEGMEVLSINYDHPNGHNTTPPRHTWLFLESLPGGNQIPALGNRGEVGKLQAGLQLLELIHQRGVLPAA